MTMSPNDRDSAPQVPDGGTVPVPRSLPLDRWPATDHAAWQAATASGQSLFSGRGSASKLEPATAANYAFAYGCWLQHLAESGELQADQPAVARFTLERMDGFVSAMQARDVGNAAIGQTLRNLRAFMGHIAPDADLKWLTQPSGFSLQQALPSKPRAVQTEDPQRGRLFAVEMAKQGAALPPGPERNRMLRDAALAAVLFATGERKRALTALRLNDIELRGDGTAVLRPAPNTVKNRKRPEYWLTAKVMRVLQLYLHEARGNFPRAQGSDRLWHGMKGPMTKEGVARSIELFNLACYGHRAGPHDVRHWITRDAMRRAPELAFDAAIQLGHSIEVAQKHYAEAGNLHAGRRHATRIDRLRKGRRAVTATPNATAPRQGIDPLRAPPRRIGRSSSAQRGRR